MQSAFFTLILWYQYIQKSLNCQAKNTIDFIKQQAYNR